MVDFLHEPGADPEHALCGDRIEMVRMEYWEMFVPPPMCPKCRKVLEAAGKEAGDVHEA